MSILTDIRDALYGNPPSTNFQPSRDGLLTAFSRLIDTLSGLVAGIQSYSNVAALPAVTVSDNGKTARVYADATASNNTFWIVKNGAWTIDADFVNILVAVVQPYVTMAQDSANKAASIVANISSLTSISTKLPYGACPQRWTAAVADALGYYDATERNTLTLIGTNAAAPNTGYSIDRVTDRSGSGNDLLAVSSSKRPTLYTGLAAPVFRFDAGLAFKTIAQNINQPLTIWAALFPVGGGAAAETIIDVGGKISFRASTQTPIQLSAGTTLASAGSLTAQWSTISGSISGGVGTLNGNGSFIATGPAGNNGLSTPVVAPVYVGDDASADAPFTGYIGMLVILPATVAVTDDLNQRLEGQAAWQFGFHEQLSLTHAYRYSPPVTGRKPTPVALYRQAGPMIQHGANGSWNATNNCDAKIIVDPKDSTKLKMYQTGQAEPPGGGIASIGLYRCSIVDFENPAILNPWTFDRVVLSVASSGWDAKSGGVRLCCIMVQTINGVTTEIMYYASQQTGCEIGIATSTDGINFARDPANPIISPGTQGRTDETDVCNIAVKPLPDGRYIGIYSYHTVNDTLPGYRYVIGSDYRTFTKQLGRDILRRPHVGLGVEALDGPYQGEDGLWYLPFEMGGVADNTPYRCMLAVAANPYGPYTIKKVLVTETQNTTTDNVHYTTTSPDGLQFHAATPGLFLLNGQWWIIWAGGPDLSEPYVNNRWNSYRARIANVFS